MAASQVAALSFDLTRLHQRTVTSFYSNLVTRPTGRAVRLGLEQQLFEAAREGGPCLSILDFSQVRVMDYSCADEVVAKLLLRYTAPDRPVNAYFLARGLQDHHLEAVEAVLERHRLLLVIEGEGDHAELLGPATTVERTCWSMLLRRGRVHANDLAAVGALVPDGQVGLRAALERFLTHRVAVSLPGELVCPLPRLRHD